MKTLSAITLCLVLSGCAHNKVAATHSILPPVVSVQPNKLPFQEAKIAGSKAVERFIEDNQAEFFDAKCHDVAAHTLTLLGKLYGWEYIDYVDTYLHQTGFWNNFFAICRQTMTGAKADCMIAATTIEGMETCDN
jgi:hypothetical protein